MLIQVNLMESKNWEKKFNGHSLKTQSLKQKFQK